MSRPLYLSIAGTKEIAGPVIITALYIKGDMNHPYLLQQFNRVRPNFDPIWLDFLLGRLLEEERIILLTSKINCFQFRTNLPIPLKVRNHVDRLIAEFTRYGLYNPYCHYYGMGLAASPREKGIRHDIKNVSYGAFLARLYANLQFRNWIKFYHNLYPYYEWDQNNGLPRQKHLEAIFQYGPSFPVHREEAIFNIGKHWYSRYKDNDWWALTKTIPPRWWKKYFPDAPFLHFLSDEEREKVEADLYNVYPSEFKEWMAINPPLPLKKAKIYRGSRLRRDSCDGRLVPKGERLKQYLCQKSRLYLELFELINND